MGRSAKFWSRNAGKGALEFEDAGCEWNKYRRLFSALRKGLVGLCLLWSERSIGSHGLQNRWMVSAR